MALTLLVIIGSAFFLLLIALSIICLLLVMRFNGYLGKHYPQLGRTNAWNISPIAANDAELSKRARRVRISLYVMLVAFVIFILSGAGIAALGI
jgi:Ca2+/Na+ antiporter